MIPQKSPSPLDCGSSIMHRQDPQCTCLVLTMMMMVKHSWKKPCNFSGISPEPFLPPSLVCQPSRISLPPPAFHHILTWSSLAAAATKLETFEVSLAEVSLRARTDWGRNSFRCCTEAWPGRYWAEYWRTRPAPPFVIGIIVVIIIVMVVIIIIAIEDSGWLREATLSKKCSFF